jgi:putative ABC transport system permease protein
MEIRPILSALLRSKTAPVLIAMQVAISLAILVNALHVVYLRHAASVRLSGVAEEENVFYITSDQLHRREHADLVAQQIRDRAALAAIPGVTDVAWTSQMPLSRSSNNTGFSVDRKQTNSSANVSLYRSPDPLVRTLGLKIVEGRDLGPADVIEINDSRDDPNDKTVQSVILAHPLAQALFPGASSFTGKSVYLGTGDDAPELRIVGVMERLQTPSASVSPSGEYSAILPWRISLMSARYAVRVQSGQLNRVMADAEVALRKASPVPIIVRATSMENSRAARYRNERALVWMLVAVSALLLMVTASGIVGMATLRVAQRRKLIGVRRALGARRRDILAYFITENFLITSAGVVTGLILAVLLNQLLVRQLEMTKLPIVYLAVGAGVLWLLGFLAVYGPAHRAASVPPAIATRSA